MDRASIYERITRQIVADLETGVLPWTKPWCTGIGRAGFAFPANAATGRPYSGINTLLLWCYGAEADYPTQRWLTFKQALGLGGSVRKGERGVPVVKAASFTPKEEKRAAEIEGRDAAMVPFLKAYTVFNVAQCDGLAPDVTGVEMATEPERDISRVEAADATIAATGVRFVIHPDKAFYHVGEDMIAMPAMPAFVDPINWYRTAFHELGHASGARHRLDRLKAFARFGSEAYAREELVAECAAAMLCAAHGIVPTVRHADYIGSWLEVLKSDNRAIFQAASLATKAADWVLDQRAEPLSAVA